MIIHGITCAGTSMGDASFRKKVRAARNIACGVEHANIVHFALVIWNFRIRGLGVHGRHVMVTKGIYAKFIQLGVSAFVWALKSCSIAPQ